MNDWRLAKVALLATLSTMGLVVEPVAANAQGAPDGYRYDAPPAADQGWNGPPPGDPYGQEGPPPYRGSPPPGRYAPPPRDPYRETDDHGPYPRYGWDEPARYAQWAARNCIDRKRDNTVAGALIGGVTGVVLSASLAGWAARGAWVLLGGSLGATAGAAIGASSGAGDCPKGYVARAGAPPPYYGDPAYAYEGPAYDPYPAYRPAPYRPWVWAGNRWVYRPDPYGDRRPVYDRPSYRPAPYPRGRY